MTVRIRLRRIGKNPKRRKFFRISVYSQTKSRDSRSIEELGYYDPSKEPPLIKINTERLNYWLSCGAQMSETVKGLVRKVDKKSSEPESELAADTKQKPEVNQDTLKRS